MIKTHDREYFYKYVTAEVAKLILETLKVRCSSPLLFNDPFDSQIPVKINSTEMDFYPFIFEKLGVEYTKELEQRIQALNNIDNLQFSEKQQSFEESLKNNILKLNQEDRVFCVSENKNNLLMWSHYAEKHTGAVIKFKCLPEKNSALCAAQKVKYSKIMPNITAEDLIRGFFNQDNSVVQKIINEILLTKSTDWEYEQEWRITLFPRSDTMFDDIGFFEEELDSIYFGCKMRDKDKNEIIEIIKSKQRKIKVFETFKDSEIFKLNFNPLQSPSPCGK